MFGCDGYNQHSKIFKTFVFFFKIIVTLLVMGKVRQIYSDNPIFEKFFSYT